VAIVEIMIMVAMMVMTMMMRHHRQISSLG
jgi:hypothetical protein